MKTKFIIALVAQLLIILLLIVYAFFQKAMADGQTILALQNKKVALQNEKKCQEAIKACENSK